MPRAVSSSAGPTPERRKKAGVPAVPAGERAPLGGGRSVEQHAVDGDVTADCQVGPTADLGGQEHYRRVLPDAVDHVDRVSAYAVLIGAIEVAHPLETVRDGRADEPRLRWRQFLVGELADRERPGPAVVGVLPARVI